MMPIAVCGSQWYHQVATLTNMEALVSVRLTFEAFFPADVLKALPVASQSHPHLPLVHFPLPMSVRGEERNGWMDSTSTCGSLIGAKNAL